MLTFQQIDARAERISGTARAACCCSLTTWKWARARSTPPPSCARSAPSPGTRPTCSPRAAPRTAATARTRTGCSTTISTRWCSSPRRDNIQELYLDSLARSASTRSEHDIRFVEDDWESPTLGAWGLGWEVWLNGMEVTQFTYFQQVGGLDCRPVLGEITYGLERLAMYLQGDDSVYDLVVDVDGVDVRRRLPPERSRAVALQLRARQRRDAVRSTSTSTKREAKRLIEAQLPLPAYEKVLKCSHTFNLLDARGAISVTERAAYIGRVRGAREAGRAGVLRFARSTGLPDVQAWTAGAA